MKTKILFLLVFALLIGASISNAQSKNNDVIILKSGKIIKGELLESESESHYVIKLKNGNLENIKRSDVIKIIQEGDKEFIGNQTRKGVKSISGGISYSNISTPMGSWSQFSLNPSIGFFISNNVLIGGAVDYTSISGGGESASMTTIGPFVELYLGKTENKFFMLSGFFVTSSEGSTQINYDFGLGYNIAIAKNLAFQPLVKYSAISFENSEFGDFSTLEVGIRLAAFVF